MGCRVSSRPNILAGFAIGRTLLRSESAVRARDRRELDQPIPGTVPAREVGAAIGTRRRPTPGGSCEAHVPAEDPPPGTTSWFPAPHVRPGRPSRGEGAAPEGPFPPVGLTWRLSGRNAFARLRRSGTKGHSGPLTVVTTPTSTPRPRVAYAIGRRVGPAVRRNRIRRRLRAIVRSMELDGSLPMGDTLVIAAPGARNMSSRELEWHLRAATGRATTGRGTR